MLIRLIERHEKLWRREEEFAQSLNLDAAMKVRR